MTARSIPAPAILARPDRRRFLARLARLAGSAATAAALLPLLPAGTRAAMVAEDDDRLIIEKASYQSEGITIWGYLARPKGAGRLPAAVVAHANLTQTDFVKDAARRLALEGFLALAPDPLSIFGGTPTTPAHEAIQNDMWRAQETVHALAYYKSAVPYLAAHAGSNGKVGMVGFGVGGGMAEQVAAGDVGLAAAVSYYGEALWAGKVKDLTAPLLLHYAGLDARIDAGIGAFTKALVADGKPYELHMYAGVDHGFAEDTDDHYDAATSDLAWSRTVAFLKRHLGE